MQWTVYLLGPVVVLHHRSRWWRITAFGFSESCIRYESGRENLCCVTVKHSWEYSWNDRMPPHAPGGVVIGLLDLTWLTGFNLSVMATGGWAWLLTAYQSFNVLWVLNPSTLQYSRSRVCAVPCDIYIDVYYMRSCRVCLWIIIIVCLHYWYILVIQALLPAYIYV